MTRPPARWFGGADAEPVKADPGRPSVWLLRNTSGHAVRFLKAERSSAGSSLDDGVLVEAERTAWLRRQGLPAPAVLDAGTEGGWDLMLTAVLPGLPLSEWPADGVRTAVQAMVDALVWLHHLPADRCPFDRGLAAVFAEAEQLVASSSTGSERERRVRVLADLTETRPLTEDLVVCHGDACLPNILADPDSGMVTGLVDLGRLGLADRHTDLALAGRSMSDRSLNPQFGPVAAELFGRLYPVWADPARLDWYRLADEL